MVWSGDAQAFGNYVLRSGGPRQFGIALRQLGRPLLDPRVQLVVCPLQFPLDPLQLRDIVHRYNCPGLLPILVQQRLTAGQQGARWPLFGGNHHFYIVEAFASKCAKQRDFFGPHPRLTIRQVEVIVVRPLLGGKRLLGQTVKRPSGAIEQSQNTVRVAGHDSDFDAVKHRFEKSLLRVQFLFRPFALGLYCLRSCRPLSQLFQLQQELVLSCVVISHWSGAV